MNNPPELLLIEDDATTREVLALLLRGDGWHVIEAESGESALTDFESRSDARAALPQVILCDCNLPGVQGSALLLAIEAIYRDRGHARPVLLAMSATAGSESSGFDATLIKPFGPADVRKAFVSASAKRQEQFGVSDDLAPDNRAPKQAISGDASLPVIDETVFLKLRGSMEMRRLEELYSFAFADAADRVRSIREATTTGDDPALQREAHMLKGSANMIGARRLAELASGLESAALTDSRTTALLQDQAAMLPAALDDIQLMLETLFPVHL